MQFPTNPADRRRFLRTLSAAGLAALAPRGAFAQKLMETAETTEGPFYPDKLPLDTDNDLLILNDGLTPAVGEITHVSGRVLTASGLPVRNAFVEIWQVDQNGSYVHARPPGEDSDDGNFQGYGRFLSDSRGRLPPDDRPVEHADRHPPLPAHPRGREPERQAHLHVAVPGQRSPDQRRRLARQGRGCEGAEDHHGGLQAAAGLDAGRADGELRRGARQDLQRAAADVEGSAEGNRQGRVPGPPPRT